MTSQTTAIEMKRAREREREKIINSITQTSDELKMSILMQANTVMQLFHIVMSANDFLRFPSLALLLPRLRLRRLLVSFE